MPPKRQLAQRSRNRNSKAIKKQLPQQSLIKEETGDLEEIGQTYENEKDSKNSASSEKNNDVHTSDNGKAAAGQNFQIVVNSCMSFCKQIIDSKKSQQINLAKGGKIEASFLLGNSEIQLLRNHISKEYNGKLETMFDVTQIEFHENLDLSAVPIVERRVKIVCNFEENNSSYFESAGKVSCTILYIISYLFTYTNRLIDPNYVSNSFESNYELNLLINKFDYLENDKILQDLNGVNNKYDRAPLSKFVNQVSHLKEFSVSENENFEFSNFFSIILKGKLESIGKSIIHLLIYYHPQDDTIEQKNEGAVTLRKLCESRCYFQSNQDDISDEFCNVKSALQNLFFKDDTFLRIPFTGIYKDPDLILQLDEGDTNQEEIINKEMVESSRMKMLEYIQKIKQEIS